MKIRKVILLTFLAMLFLSLIYTGAFAQINMGDYTLSGDVELGGRFFIERPSPPQRGYFELYRPYPPGFLLEELNLLLMNKDESEYYKFFMTRPGERDQDYLLQGGKYGCYKFELEYGELQHLYSTVDPNQDEIRTLWQTFRFAASYTPKPEIDISADYTFLHQSGEIPKGEIDQGFQGVDARNAPPFPSANVPPFAISNNGNPAFKSFLEPVDSDTHTVNAAAEYAEKGYQFRVAYNLSLFENDIKSITVPSSVSKDFTIALAPSNMAQYVTGTGGLNLPCRTRINGSFSYGWLSQDDTLISNPIGASGGSDLGATTIQGNLTAVSRPVDSLTLRFSYRGYDFQDDNLSSDLLQNAFVNAASVKNSSNKIVCAVCHTDGRSGATSTPPADHIAFGLVGARPGTLNEMHYSFLRQTVSTGAEWKFNSMAAVDFDYRFDKVDRDSNNGDTTESTPKVGVKFYPCDWLNLLGSYAHSSRSGSDSLVFGNVFNYSKINTSTVPDPEEVTGALLQSKFYAADRDRNVVNFIAEVLPMNNFTISANFSLYDDSYNNSFFGLQKDRGWSAGADVNWTPFKCLSATFGYLHEYYRTQELADAVNSTIDIDTGPTLITADSFDTFTLGGNLVIIPEKLDLASRGSYSFSISDFQNPLIPNLQESILHFDTYLRYRFNKCMALKLGYVFEKFNISNQYETLSPSQTPVQNDLDGYYKDYTAHMIVGLMQYKF